MRSKLPAWCCCHTITEETDQDVNKEALIEKIKPGGAFIFSFFLMIMR